MLREPPVRAGRRGLSGDALVRVVGAGQAQHRGRAVARRDAVGHEQDHGLHAVRLRVQLPALQAIAVPRLIRHHLRRRLSGDAGDAHEPPQPGADRPLPLLELTGRKPGVERQLGLQHPEAVVDQTSRSGHAPVRAIRSHHAAAVLLTRWSYPHALTSRPSQARRPGFLRDGHVPPCPGFTYRPVSSPVHGAGGTAPSRTKPFPLVHARAPPTASFRLRPAPAATHRSGTWLRTGFRPSSTAPRRAQTRWPHDATATEHRPLRTSCYRR